MNRREALKRMGASALAMAVGASGVASLLESCADKPKAETELERMFARACGGEVKASVTEAILRGDKSCVYRIELLQITD